MTGQEQAINYSIIVPAWNEALLLPQTLSMLTTAMAAQISPGELIVVDNNSSDDTAAVARQHGATVVFEPENNIAKARNAGAAVACGKILIFVDADTQVGVKLLTETVNRMSSGKYYAGGASLAFDAPIPWFARRMTALWNHIAPRRKLAAGCYIYCLKTAFDEAGGFSGVRYAAEEIYFCRAMRQLNRQNKLKFSHISSFPVVSSARKMTENSTFRMFVQMFLLGTFSFLLRRKSACVIWYKR